MCLPACGQSLATSQRLQTMEKHSGRIYQSKCHAAIPFLPLNRYCNAKKAYVEFTTGEAAEFGIDFIQKGFAFETRTSFTLEIFAINKGSDLQGKKPLNFFLFKLSYVFGTLRGLFVPCDQTVDS